MTAMLPFFFYYLAGFLVFCSALLYWCLQHYIGILVVSSGMLMGITLESSTLVIFSFAEFPLSLLRLSEIFFEALCFYAESPFLTSLYETRLQSLSVDLSELILYIVLLVVGGFLIRGFVLCRFFISVIGVLGFFLLTGFFIVLAPSLLLNESWIGLVSIVTDDFTFFEESSDRFILASPSSFSVLIFASLVGGFCYSSISQSSGSVKFWRNYFWIGLIVCLVIWDFSCLALLLCMCTREALVLVVLLRKEYLRMF